MPDAKTPAPSDGPPESFVDQVKDVLEHLYDFSFLQRHPLAQALGGGSDQAVVRRRMLDAVETLNPGPGIAFRAPPARPYYLLNLRYVEGMTVQEVARELGISQRQAYRDLRHAEESVAAILWPHAGSTPTDTAQSSASIQDEVARLAGQPLPIDIVPLVRRALGAVEALAQQRALDLRVTLPETPVVASADPMVAQQVIVGLLSFALRQAHGPSLSVELTPADPDATLRVAFRAESSADALPALNPVTLQLAAWMGWRVAVDAFGPERAIVVGLPAHGPTVLIVDDNAGLVDLLQRYLADQPYRVMTASGGREGLRLAREAAPSVIVLDVMMPEMDGWEILQRLRTYPDTAQTPVIICSAVGEPELAQSLGATAFLQKPVRREDFLAALRQAGAPR